MNNVIIKFCDSGRRNWVVMNCNCADPSM